MRALGVVVVARVALWVLPFQRLRLLVERRLNSPPRTPPSGPPRRIAWAVSTVARFVPRASCLTQALAAQWLLATGGQPAHLRIGVAKGEDGALRAHAWLESGGQVLIGGGGVEEFTAFPPLEGKMPI